MCDFTGTLRNLITDYFETLIIMGVLLIFLLFLFLKFILWILLNNTIWAACGIELGFAYYFFYTSKKYFGGKMNKIAKDISNWKKKEQLDRSRVSNVSSTKIFVEENLIDKWYLLIKFIAYMQNLEKLKKKLQLINKN